MRQINADALKEEITQYFNDVMDNNEIKTINTVISIIDNAPTVELFCSYLSDGEVRESCVEAPCEHEKPQGDLISREALKKQTKQFGDLYGFNPVWQIIDNAPTVESEDNAIQYTKVYQDGFFEGKKLAERPQGYWNYIQAGMAVCPFCGGTRRDNRIDHISFCNKCGASMVKGGEE